MRLGRFSGLVVAILFLSCDAHAETCPQPTSHPRSPEAAAVRTQWLIDARRSVTASKQLRERELVRRMSSVGMVPYEDRVTLIGACVDRFGRVKRTKISASSGFQQLDLDAMQLVQSTHLPPFPYTMMNKTVSITVPVLFHLDSR